MVQKATVADPTDGATILPDMTKEQLSNGPDKGEGLFFKAQIEGFEKQKKEIADKLKKVRQLAKNRGLNLDAFDAVRKEAAKKDDTTARWMKDFSKYAQWMDLPIGSMMVVYDSPAEAADAEPKSSDLAQKAYDHGYSLGVQGGNPDEQKWGVGMPEHQSHLDGWHAGQKVNQDLFLRMNEGLDQMERDALKAQAEKAAKKLAKDIGDLNHGEVDKGEISL